MALPNADPFITSPSFYCVARFSYCLPFSGPHGDSGAGNSGFCVGSHAVKSDVLIERTRFKPMNTHSVENNNNDYNNLIKPTFEIPVSCYQLIGVPDQAEKDEIVKAVMGLKNAEIEEGYTMDVVASRQDLLMDVRDKLLFEPEYAGDPREKIPPKSSLHIPWSWVPVALCLLQEVGESKLVLDIGWASLQHQDAKPYVDDLLLAMALAECAIAKIGFEKKKVSQGFEALARAQCILRSKPSLAKMTLLSQGLDVEASCQVQDWPSFLSQAFDNLLANEIVDLLPWDNLAVMRKNKKTIESQNLRVVIDANCFYRVFAAHMALGFSSKQKELINKAKNICECLIASEGIDLKFEEAFCLFLLGQTEAVERLKQLELNLNPKHNSVLGKAIIDASAANPSLNIEFAISDLRQLAELDQEMWLKDSVLALFPDTKDCSPALANFFNARKKFSGSKETKGAAQTLPSICHRPLSSSSSLYSREIEEPRYYMSSSPNIGFATEEDPILMGGNIADRLKKILLAAKISFLHKSGAGKHNDLHASLTSSSSPINAYRKFMPVEEAETLVKQWKTIKAEALGPSHEVNCLAEVLNESMLAQWQALADAAKEKSCHWRFLLLNLSVIQAEILLNGNGGDIAEIEALLRKQLNLLTILGKRTQTTIGLFCYRDVAANVVSSLNFIFWSIRFLNDLEIVSSLA
ncbi:hypothetical protein TanjilG_16113 [Lupinus angustifolius]|uniref:Uncharacterized protein n=1 Tax=Lupinus angustifolius TaxID=3871 RepID=A0A1J7I053_LUPAN|nr:hypothetical protein TanjilG_16113 [Lupinus angustifolius]